MTLVRMKSRLVPSLLALVDVFVPRHFIDPDLQRRGRLLVASSLALLVICLYFGLLMAGLQRYPHSSYIVMLLGVILALFNPILLRISGSIVLVGLLLCLETLAIISYQAFNDNGLADPTLLWNLIIPWLAAFLVGPVYGFVFAGIVTVITALFFLLEITGYSFPDYSTEQEVWLFYFMSASTVALFTGFLGWLYEGQTIGSLRTANMNLKNAHKALQESNRRVASILESITDGFFAIDQYGRFSYINHRAERLLDRKRADILGRNAWRVFVPHIEKDILREMLHAARSGVSTEIELLYSPLNRWLEIHAYPFSGGLSVYFRDITERRDYQNKLIQAKEQAEELARMKSSFVANISHEIRTPLTGILGFASVLAKEVTGEHQEFATLIEQNGHRLMATLNSVLDLARLDSGQAESRQEVVGVVQEVEDVIRLFTPVAHERGLYLKLEHRAESAEILCDRLYLRQVMNNLIGNAVKFTDEGGVVVKVATDGAAVTIAVTDTGVGISDAFLPHLYEEFRQESWGLDRSHQGSGLGLAITRRLVAAMGGDIKVASKKGAGTTFIVRLPLYQSTLSAHPAG